MSTEFDPRRASPGEAFEFTDAEGTIHRFAADDEGVVHPSNAEEVRIADARGLPVARKVLAAQREAEGDKE